MAKSVGYRFGPYLPTVVPLVVAHCKQAKESDDELKEQCLQVGGGGGLEGKGGGGRA